MFVPVSAVSLQAGWAADANCDGFTGKICPALTVFVPQKGVNSPLGLATSAGSSAALGAAQDLGFLAFYCSGVAAAVMSHWVHVTLSPGRCFQTGGSLGITSGRDWPRRNRENCPTAGAGTHWGWMKERGALGKSMKEAGLE